MSLGLLICIQLSIVRPGIGTWPTLALALALAAFPKRSSTDLLQAAKISYQKEDSSAHDQLNAHASF